MRQTLSNSVPRVHNEANTQWSRAARDAGGCPKDLHLGYIGIYWGYIGIYWGYIGICWGYVGISRDNGK